MKRILKQSLVVCLALVLCIAMLPIDIFAWSYMSHVNSANIFYLECMSKAVKSLSLYAP